MTVTARIPPTARKDRPPPGEAGYTLLEVLIALSLVAMLSAGLVSGVGTGVRVWNMTDERSTELSEAAVLDAVLRGHLQRIVPVTAVDSDRRATLVFSGTDRQIRYLTLAGAGIASRGLFGEQLEIRDEEDQPRLIMRRAAQPVKYTTALTDQAWEVSALSLPGNGAAFRYYGQKAGDREAVWHDSWQDQPGLPELIGLRLRPETEDRTATGIMIRPRIQVSDIRIPVQSLTLDFEASGGAGK